MVNKEKIIERLVAILNELEQHATKDTPLYWYLVGKLKAYDLVLAEDVPTELWDRIDKFIEL